MFGKVYRKEEEAMKTMMKIGNVMVAVMLAGSVCMAEPHRGDFRGHYDGGRHYGYYHNNAGDLVFGLLGLGVAAAIISSVNHPPVYVEQPSQVVYETPQIIQQPIVVQQVQYVPPQPVIVTINVQNSNGSFSPVTLRQVGVQWVGPRGEYYMTLPSVGQLRPIYGF